MGNKSSSFKNKISYQDVNANLQCSIHSDTADKCDYVHRMIQALISFNSSTNTHNYTNLLNDWIHLIVNHSSQIDKIHTELIKNYNINHCAVSKCKLISRHYRNNRRTNKINTTQDAKLAFYDDIMDTIHNFLFHLTDLGLRSNDNVYHSQIKNTLINQHNQYNVYDEIFAKKKTFISKQRKMLGFVVERFIDNNNKFNIHSVSSVSSNKEETFMDIMLKCVATNANSNEINQLRKYLNDEEFDTDSIGIDVNNNYINSNILKQFKHKTYIHLLLPLVKGSQLISKQFNAGLIFYYWPYYKVNHNEYDNKKINSNPFNYN
eukprot:347611_1